MKSSIKKITTAVSVLALVFSFGLFVPTESVSANTVKDEIQSGINAGKGDGVSDGLFTGDNTFGNIINTFLFVIGALSVVMLIYGGIRYTTSGGNANSVTAAKNTIMYAIIGLVVAFIAFAVVNWVLASLGTTA